MAKASQLYGENPFGMGQQKGGNSAIHTYGTFVLFLALAPRTFSTSYLLMAIANVNGRRLYRHYTSCVATLL